VVKPGYQVPRRKEHQVETHVVQELFRTITILWFCAEAILILVIVAAALGALRR
jgi:hypothetical protein